MNPKNEAKKQEIYEFILEFMKEYGVCPSTAEIAEGTNCAKSTAHKYLIRLQDEGYIEKFGRNQILLRENMYRYDKVPVVGAIACGKPILAIEDIETYIPINRDILGEGDFIALIAKGDSMIEAGIDSGDIVFIKRQPTALDGQIVAVILEDEFGDEAYATLKRFYRDSKNKRFRLHPENSTMKDIYVEKVNIVGVAVKILKNVK